MPASRTGRVVTTQLGRHGRLAREYWETYRPRALAGLGGPAERDAFFHVLDLRVAEMIGELTGDLLQRIPAGQRAVARSAVRAQAQELVYAREVYLAKEPGTAHREM